MAPPDDSSNIRVFVQWHDQTVFAGEEVKCTITFKNVAPSAEQQKQQQQVPAQSDRSRLASSLHTRAKASIASSIASGRGHRKSALSLSAPPSTTHNRTGSLQWPPTMGAADGRPGHAHKRSVSIVSIGSSTTVDDHAPRSANDAPAFPQRPARGHSRATSLQIVPREQPSPISPSSPALFSARNPTSPASYPPNSFRIPRNSSTLPNGSKSGSLRRTPRGSPNPMPEFSFPAAPPTGADPPKVAAQPTDNTLLSPTIGFGDTNNHTKDLSDRPAPAARILSSNSLMSATPRSSGEFYPMSNHSSETLASEYVNHAARGHGSRPSHLRKSSSLVPQNSKKPESLMMGYAQIQGSFTLDGSLVSLSPFEQVKKKAVVGGRGGGVVGLESKRENGLLKGFGWGNLSSSFSDFLGGGELSTIREMRTVANSKSVPLLSTPQSILFVDLQLAPGQSRDYEYVFKLPKGLPPTHKGKAVKISYSLVIGTQRAGGAKEQQVCSVETSFKVLGSVNSVGEILGHDLMSPYILLRDEAQVKVGGKSNRAHKSKALSQAPATLNEFLSYADELISRPRDEDNGTLLSPTAGENSRRPSIMDQQTTAKEAIHLAIMRSNMTSDGQQSPNRFEIARNGLRVGVVMLTRPSYRLGEVVTMAIDLTSADIPCYAIHASLETSEKVDSSLAVRSESSIHRVTRKVYSTTSEVTLYSRRVVFTPTIPISATPEFITSGVSLDWKIRVEFVVPAPKHSESPERGDYHHHQPPSHPLLEQISQDDRGGLVLAAAEHLACESFDIAVPLRVYGAVGSGLERLERDEAADEGLVV